MGLIAFGLRSSARVEWNGAKGEIGSKARQAWTDIGKMGILKRTTYYEQQREQKKNTNKWLHKHVTSTGWSITDEGSYEIQKIDDQKT